MIFTFMTLILLVVIQLMAGNDDHTTLSNQAHIVNPRHPGLREAYEERAGLNHRERLQHRMC